MGSYQADVEDAGEGPVVEATELVQSTLKRFERYAAANDICVIRRAILPP